VRPGVLALLASVALGGCAGTSFAPAPAISLRIAPATGVAVPAFTAPPTSPQCHVVGTTAQAYRSAPSGVALRATRDGVPFADMTFVTAERVELTLEDGTGNARLDAEVDHVWLSAWTERDAFLYEPSGPVALEGYFAPYLEPTPLWSFVGQGQFRADVPVPAGLRRVDGGDRLQASRPCEAMTLLGSWSIDRTMLGAAPAARIVLDSWEAVQLPVGASVPLSLTPGGPTVAFLEPAAPMTLQVRDAPAGMASPAPDLAYVVWDTTAALVFGWVERARLGPITGGGGYGRSISCGTPFTYHGGPRHFRQCADEIPLFVRAGAEPPTPTGSIAREALLRLKGAASGELTEVDPQTRGLSLSLREEASFLVRTSDLAACPDVVIDD
jgi:hypothetical protein